MNYILIFLCIASAIVALILIRKKQKSIPESGFAIPTKNGSVFTYLRVTSKGRFMFRSDKGKIISMDLGSMKKLGLTQNYDFKSILKN